MILIFTSKFPKYLFSILLLFIFSTFHLAAQNITFNTSEPDGVTVCGESAVFSVEFTNNTTTTLQNVSITLVLPTGIVYEPGSIVEGATSTIQESNVSNLSSIGLSSNDIAANETVAFTFEASANFEAYNSQIAGNTFSNNIVVNYDGGSESETTSTFNVLYAALSITNVSPMATSVFVGGTFQRTVTIVNGGYGSLSNFTLNDIHDANSTLESVDVGLLNAEGNQITFTSSDFTGFGNGDDKFDQNEAITVTQTINVSGCNSFQSQLFAEWGCGGEIVASNDKFPFTTVVLYPPDLSFTPIPSFSTCMTGGADNQQISITNNGSGPANNTEIVITPIYDQQYTRSDISSIKLTTASGVIPLTPTATKEAINYDCLGTDPKDGFTVLLPTIGPGETVVLDWDNYTCPTTYCGIVRLLGWEFESTYTDMCFSENYETTNIGQEHTRKNMSTFFESPADLVDQQEGNYSLILTGATFSLHETASAYFEVAFDIPVGLNWNGTPQDADLTYSSGTNTWNPSDVQYDNATRKLTAKYPMPIPNGFTMVNSTFDLDLTADCSAGVGTVTVGMQLFYIMDTDCNSIFRMPMTCYETAITQLHCPGPCPHGMAFQSFDVERTSLGQSDNDRDGLPDASNNLDYTKVKTNRVMVSDTFNTTFNGKVLTSATYPSWQYGYAKSTVPHGQYLEIIGAQITILDASSGQTLTCDNVSFVDALLGDNRVVDFDFSPVTLLANGCTDFSGYVMDQDDEVHLTATYRVKENPGGMVEQVTIQNEFYLSDTANGSKFQCNDWNGNFTLIGYYFFQYNSEQYDVKTCTKTITQNYYMSIGVCCSSYNGGNIFPYEYRNWGNVKNLRVEIPDGYNFVSGQVKQWRTKHTNGSVLETAQITPSSTNGTQHYFSLEDYHVQNGGTLNLSDDGFRGTVSIEVEPNCNVNEAANLPVNWYFTFQENTVLGGIETNEYAFTPDYIQYYRGDIVVTTPLPTQEATSSTVSWDLKIKSSNSNTNNSWVHLDYIGTHINILEVKDLSDNTVLTPVNGFYQLGDMTINELKNIQITADYNACTTTEIKVTSGYDCDGYPTSLTNYTCPSEELMLYIIPEPSELQVKFNSETLSADECGNEVSVELEMLSSKLATVENLFVNITQPGSGNIDIIPSTMQVLYPNNGTYSFITDPVVSGGVYTISGADMDAIIGQDGLVGITDISANIVKLKFNIQLESGFKPGDFLTIDIGGDRPCGTALPTLSLVVDPSAKFEANGASGLEEEGDDWAVAWGDYDNDGFVDVFITDYRLDAPNRLYQNNGDGTFTKVTTGVIVTDMAASLGASWGDYDNDGDLDIFVANNIGTTNWLYRNDGAGNFTKIINDPIVNYNGYSHGVAWADYDNDGYLDMFVADYFSTRFNHLYRNNGDGTFTDESTATPSLEAGSSIIGLWGDYNNDGMIDLFVANIENENNSLYKNIGNGNFEKITSGAIVNDGGNSVGASWGDYNNDGYLDLFVSNAGEQDNFLYRNNGDETFTKITTGSIVNDGGHSHGSAWGDYDNDGDIDLFVSNDSDTPNFLYSNNGDGTFTKLTNSITEVEECSFGAAWADIDNDLDLDLFVANRNMDGSHLYENSRGRCQNKACLVLVGSNSNKSAIGAKIHLKANIYGESIWQMREVSSQTGGGIGGQNDLKNLIGLGDATTIDSLIIEWPSGYRQVVTGAAINDCTTIVEDQGGEICGVAYNDENGNCVQDGNESVLANIDILIQPGNRIVTTDDNGAYSVFVSPDVYQLEQVANDLWTPTCQISLSVNVDQMGQTYCGNNFANTAVNPEADVSIEISSTPHRIGEENLIALTYCNNGTMTATDVVVQLTIDERLTLLESSIPWNDYTGQTATWNLGDLEIGACQTIFVKEEVSTETEVGEIIDITAVISTTETETIYTNNTDTNSEEAVGSFDPNDILVSPEGYIDNDQDLFYTIRFQNVGNASASTVRVEDVLPEDLNMETLVMGSTSHAYRLDIEDGNVLIWTFDNINLVDSTTNEVESNGFINFKIKPIQNLEEGTRIENNAAIYFDNNNPILTNTVINIIGEEPRPDLADGNEAAMDIFPNPMTESSVIQILDNKDIPIKINSILINDVSGKSVYAKKGINVDEFKIEKGNYTPGYYFVRAVAENGKEYVSKLIIH